MKRKGYTLIELLASMATLSIALGIATKLFLIGLKWQVYTTDMTRMHQHARILTSSWRGYVAHTSAADWTCDRSMLSAGATRVDLVDGALRLSEAGALRQRTLIPDGMTCSVDVERSELGDCAVLWMEWVSIRNHFSETNRVRAVACGDRL